MKTSVLLLIMASIVSFSVFASENTDPDNDQLLLASCQALAATPEQEHAKSCIYFIQGYLASAQTIDPSIIKKQRESRKVYSFMSRPYRSPEQNSPIRFLPFCLPDDKSEDQIIKIFSKQLLQKIDTTNRLKDMIFKALKDEYPCGNA